MERVEEVLYYDFKTFLLRNYPYKKLGKIGLSFNIPCPNNPPCSFCNASSFIPHTIKGKISIKEQVSSAIPYLGKKYRTDSFIAYFQDNTSTYGDRETLLSGYSDATSFDEIKILNLSTRPDYIDEEVIETIKKGSNGKPVWIELGAQTFDDDQLKRIDRGHDVATFMKGYHLLRELSDFKIGVHIIIGLPYETDEEIVNNSRVLTAIKPDYIKISQLQIVKGSRLEDLYNSGGYSPLSLEEYIEKLSLFISHLSPDIALHRVVGSAHIDQLIAPIWGVSTLKLKDSLLDYMKKKSIVQGCAI